MHLINAHNFLEHLACHDLKKKESLLTTDADFRLQHRLMQCLSDSGVQDINFQNLFSTDKEQFDTECADLVEKLLHQKSYDLARKFSALCKLQADQITIRQVSVTLYIIIFVEKLC